MCLGSGQTGCPAARLTPLQLETAIQELRDLVAPYLEDDLPTHPVAFTVDPYRGCVRIPGIRPLCPRGVTCQSTVWCPLYHCYEVSGHTWYGRALISLGLGVDSLDYKEKIRLEEEERSHPKLTEDTEKLMAALQAPELSVPLSEPKFEAPDASLATPSPTGLVHPTQNFEPTSPPPAAVVPELGRCPKCHREPVLLTSHLAICGSRTSVSEPEAALAPQFSDEDFLIPSHGPCDDCGLSRVLLEGHSSRCRPVVEKSLIGTVALGAATLALAVLNREESRELPEPLRTPEAQLWTSDAAIYHRIKSDHELWGGLVLYLPPSHSVKQVAKVFKSLLVSEHSEYLLTRYLGAPWSGLIRPADCPILGDAIYTLIRRTQEFMSGKPTAELTWSSQVELAEDLGILLPSDHAGAQMFEKRLAQDPDFRLLVDTAVHYPNPPQHLTHKPPNPDEPGYCWLKLFPPSDWPQLAFAISSYPHWATVQDLLPDETIVYHVKGNDEYGHVILGPGIGLPFSPTLRLGMPNMDAGVIIDSASSRKMPALLEIGNATIREAVFTHRSRFHRPRSGPVRTDEGAIDDNEYHELLGDSTGNLATRLWLMTNFPTLRVGVASKVCMLVTSNATLAKVCAHYDLQSRLISNPAQAVSLQFSPIVRADLFEAYLGGLLLDIGFDATYQWLSRVLEPYILAALRSCCEGYYGPERQRLSDTIDKWSPNSLPEPIAPAAVPAASVDPAGPGPLDMLAELLEQLGVTTNRTSRTPAPLVTVQSPVTHSSPSDQASAEMVANALQPPPPQSGPPVGPMTTMLAGDLNLLNQINQNSSMSIVLDVAPGEAYSPLTPVWECTCLLNGTPIASSHATTKKTAKSNAAAEFMSQLRALVPRTASITGYANALPELRRLSIQRLQNV